MTSSPPPPQRWESLAERRIREAAREGAFDNLPGAGRPIPGDDQPLDEMWWVRDKLRREGLSFLPPSLEMRLEAEKTSAAICDAPDEATVRELVEELNRKIRNADGSLITGPASTVGWFDADEVVARWKRERLTKASKAKARSRSDE